MKKLLCVCMIAVMLLVLGGCSSAGTDPVQTEAPAAPTESASEPTCAPAEPVFRNGIFDFTGADFADRFADTLPEGYTFATPVQANPDRHNKLQTAVLNASGADTGIALLLNVKDSAEAFSKLALTAAADADPEEFTLLAEWYISVFLSDWSAQEQEQMLQTYVERFTAGSSEHCVKATDAHVVMLLREAEQTGDHYYIVIALN